MIIKSTGQCYRLYALLRTRGTLTARKADVKMTQPQHDGGCRESPPIMLIITTTDFPNYFIYLINCSAFDTICELDAQADHNCKYLYDTGYDHLHHKGRQVVEIHRNRLPNIDVTLSPCFSASEIRLSFQPASCNAYSPDRKLYSLVHSLSSMRVITLEQIVVRRVMQINGL